MLIAADARDVVLSCEMKAMLGQAQGRDERAMSVQRRAVVLPMQVAPCFSLPCKLKPMPRQVLVQGFYIRQARLLCVPLAFGSLVVAVACTRQVTRLKRYVSNRHRLSFARMRSMRERRGRSRGSCDEVNRRDRSLCEGGSVPPTIFPVTMKVDPYPGSQHAGRQLDSMERATDRLRRIITTALAAVVWKQHGAAHVPRTFDTGR